MIKINKPVSFPIWLVAIIIIILIILLSSGGYGYSEHKKLKKDYKDSTKVRKERIKELQFTLKGAFDFEDTEIVKTKSWWNEYKREKKLRKDAEAELYDYRVNDRFYNYRYLSGYKYRRD